MPPGSYTVDASCNNSFDGGASKSAQVAAGQTVGVHFTLDDVSEQGLRLSAPYKAESGKPLRASTV